MLPTRHHCVGISSIATEHRNAQLNRLALERQRKSQSELKLLLDFIPRTELLQNHEVLISH
jgi:hypothetical protein